METFICWLFIIIVILGAYSYYLIRRSPKGYRLQVKLTIIFFLLVLIPSIILTLIVSGLLNQSVQMSFFPEIEKSLSQSLRVIKNLMENQGHSFFRAFPDLQKIQVADLQKFDIHYVLQYQYRKDAFEMQNEIISRPDIKPNVSHEKLHQIFNEKLSCSIIKIGDTAVSEVYKILPDSIIKVIGLPIQDDIVSSKDLISESLKIYTSLSLVKKSVLEGRLIWGVAILFIIVLMFIAIYSARVLSRGISNPIQQLASAMEKVAEGTLPPKVTVQAKDEIQILVNSFNKMAEDLKISQQKLIQAERLAAWRDVARRISHEIKNSLTPIQISLYRIKNSCINDDGEIDDKAFGAIQEEVESLRRIAEEFSQFARMPQVKKERDDINKIIQHLMPLIEGGAKPVKINLDLDHDVPHLMLDRDQIKRALNNLLKNSIEASSIGGLISVKTTFLKSPGERVMIEIKDYGHGMDQQTVLKIFEPYFTTKQRGMGLGLSIVKRIIEDHEGEIQIESQSGKYTKVTITFNC